MEVNHLAQGKLQFRLVAWSHLKGGKNTYRTWEGCKIGDWLGGSGERMGKHGEPWGRVSLVGERALSFRNCKASIEM